MNTKWFSGVGLAILLGTGTFIYTTKTQARPKAATAAKPDATLENLTTCATEKNPAYLESVLKGAMQAFDKDAKAALKAGKPAEFKKASKNLLKVIKFLFAQSKHFSPIYKDAAHKATFDKDINKVVQTLFKAEYGLGESKSAQKEVIKDYTAVVAELEKDGVANLTPIAAPKETKSTLAKLKDGLGKAGHAVASGAKKAVKKVKDSESLQKGLMGAGAAAIGGGGAAAIAKAAIQPDEDAPADDADAPADLETEDAGTFEPEDADADAADDSDEEPTDDADVEPADLETEDAGTFELDDADSDPDADADYAADADDSEPADEEAPADDADYATDEEAPADDVDYDADEEPTDDADYAADDSDADADGDGDGDYDAEPADDSEEDQ